MAQVKVLSERCKGCGLCVLACPKSNLALGKDYNAQGYAYVTFKPDGKCTGCTFCAELCPDMALRVFKEERD